MNGEPSGNSSRIFLFGVAFLLSLVPLSWAGQSAMPEESGQENSPSQAQSTMASLFSRGAKMPGIPQMAGTIALPSFDSRGLKIEETSLDEAQRGERGTGSGERSPENASVQR